MDTSSNNINSMASPLQVPTFEGYPKVFSSVRFNVHTIHLAGKRGNIINRDVVVHPGAVVILPLVDEKHLIMIRNVRFAVGQELWELPAGTLEPRESPLETAKREIIEETGYRANHVEFLTRFFTSPGFCNELMHAYVAKDLVYVGQNLEDSEYIIVEVLPWDEVLEMVRDGVISDGKTIATLLHYHTFYSQKT